MSSHFASAHFGAAHYESSHYGRTGVIIPPVIPPGQVHPPGMGRRAQIIREDEEIMAIIVAFLHMKGR